jgi:mono/diheme cytochrome c family protein
MARKLRWLALWISAFGLVLGGRASRSDTNASASPAQRGTSSVYLGWRMYEANCARCHGADASGSVPPRACSRASPA